MRDLTPEQLHELFVTDVIDHLHDNRNPERPKPGERPWLVCVGGQPGAGKTNVVKASGHEHPGSIIVDGDSLRRFHPDYERAMNEEPLAMPDITAQAIGNWVEMSSQWLREQQISAVIESTLRQKDFLLDEFSAYRNAGYATELRVVAVPLEVSRLGTLARYVGQAQELGAGRSVTSQGHDNRAAQVPKTVETLIASGLVDHLIVQDRDNRIFADMDVSHGGPELATQAREVVDRAREVHTMTPQQAQAWFQTAKPTIQALTKVPVNHDLLTVSTRLVTTDAKAIAPQAWPKNQSHQQHEIATLQRSHLAAARTTHTTQHPQQQQPTHNHHHNTHTHDQITPHKPDHGIER